MCDICGNKKYISVIPVVGNTKYYPCPECSNTGSPELLSLNVAVSDEEFFRDKEVTWNMVVHRAKEVIIDKIFDDKMYEVSFQTNIMTYQNTFNFKLLIHPGPHVKALQLDKKPVLFREIPNDYRLDMLKTLI